MWTTGNEIIDAIAVEVIVHKYVRVSARKVGEHRGYNIFLLENGGYQAFKNGNSVSCLDFNTAWGAICYIDELLSP